MAKSNGKSRRRAHVKRRHAKQAAALAKNPEVHELPTHPLDEAAKNGVVIVTAFAFAVAAGAAVREGHIHPVHEEFDLYQTQAVGNQADIAMSTTAGITLQSSTGRV